MTHSMTAFASVQKQLGKHTLSWELKSVNHRYFDVSFRMPEAYRYLEVPLRTMLQGKVHRGKLECQLKLHDTISNQPEIFVNAGLVEALVKAGATIAANQQISNDLAVSHLLNWPDIIQVKATPAEGGLSADIQASFNDALMQLLLGRFSEGSVLKDHILTRLELLRDEHHQTQLHVLLTADDLKEKLLNRLDNLKLTVEESRLDQEIALLVMRSDVSEELDRIETHINEAVRIVQSDDVVGKALDFLMQELNREANTLGSKSHSVRLTQHALQMKLLIEQMREQIQNIE
jgi:uncharacterized protein (TIGR00255 family)